MAVLARLTRVVLALAVVCPALAQAGEPGDGKIVRAAGQVTLRPPGGLEGPAYVGAVVTRGTQLRTGPDGSAEVDFDDGSIVRLHEDSSVLLSANHKARPKLAVLLFFGRLWSKVYPSRTGERAFEVATANAVCGVRGTEFETQVGDDGSMRLTVTEGQVGVDGEGGRASAGAGQQVEANEKAVGAVSSSGGQTGWAQWQADRRERLRTQAAAIVAVLETRINTRVEELEARRAQQRDLQARRKPIEERARRGEQGAADELHALDEQLVTVSEAIAQVGDEARVQLGTVDHFAELASDPRLAGVDRGLLQAKAASLQRARAAVDRLVAEGTRGSETTGTQGSRPSERTPGATSPSDGVPDSRKLESSQAAVARMRDVLGRVLKHLEDARAERDVIKLNCVNEKLTAIKGLLRIAEQADVALQEAVSRKDSETAGHEFDKISIAQRKSEQLLSESESCVGELAVYSGSTQVDVVIEESARAAPDPTANLGAPLTLPQVLDRPPVASPYQ
jgi:hypothetical protein